MPYFRIDDAFPSHPKVLAIPRRDRAAAIGLWALAGSWCSAQLTDGHLAEHMVDELASSKKYADLLVKVGLWERTESGYLFHDWLGWQGFTREEVLAKRSADAERKRKWREAKAAKQAGTDTDVPGVSQRDNPRTDNGTTASVQPESALTHTHPIPYPSTTHPSVSYGDRDGSPGGGNVPLADAREIDEPPTPLADLPEPPLCRRHEGWDRDAIPGCAACGRLRVQWETARATAAQSPPRPPWCGHCDQHTRQREAPDGAVYRCPECHPLAIGVPA